MIFALNFGLFNEFGEYLVTVGHSVAFLFPLLLKFGTADKDWDELQHFDSGVTVASSRIATF